MISIGATHPASTGVQSFRSLKIWWRKPRLPGRQRSQDSTTAPLRAPKEEEGVKVTISGAALKALSDVKQSNNDIEESGLPDNVQQVLKMIRQIKAQIAEKQAELQAVMADKRLTPEEARIKISNLQGALSSLQASLVTAQTSLAKTMKGLSSQDALKAASLSV